MELFFLQSRVSFTLFHLFFNKKYIPKTIGCKFINPLLPTSSAPGRASPPFDTGCTTLQQSICSVTGSKVLAMIGLKSLCGATSKIHKFSNKVHLPSIQETAQSVILRFFPFLSLLDTTLLLASATCAIKAVKTPLTLTSYLADVSAKIQFFPRDRVEAIAWLTSRLSVPDVRSHLFPINTIGTSSVPLAS